MRTHQPLLASLVLGMGGVASGEREAACPGAFDVQGIGSVSLVPTGWATPVNMTYPRVRESDGVITTPLNSRSYFASSCTPGVYDNRQYLALDLRGKTLIYTTDLSNAGCGCNAAFYLTSMGQNKRKSECGDHYCDANNVCGESCTEIDIQEANQFSWHSTLHDSWDHAGMGTGYGGGGYGWSGPRDLTAADFGPDGKCVDTKLPFEVSVYFRMDARDKLEAMEVTLTQHGKNCPLWMKVGDYSGIKELDAALAAGMTPIVSYWSSDDLQWMDGKGADGQGPCFKDEPRDCGEAVRFYNFSVTPSFPATTATTSPKPPSTPAARSPFSMPDGKSAHAFVAGAFTMLVAELIVGLAVWVVMGLRTPRGQNVCDSVNMNMNPLRRVLAGSSQSLLLLAETGEGGVAAAQEAPAAAAQPIRETSVDN